MTWKITSVTLTQSQISERLKARFLEQGVQHLKHQEILSGERDPKDFTADVEQVVAGVSKVFNEVVVVVPVILVLIM